MVACNSHPLSPFWTPTLQSLVQFKKWNAKRKLRAAVHGVRTFRFLFSPNVHVQHADEYIHVTRFRPARLGSPGYYLQPRQENVNGSCGREVFLKSRSTTRTFPFAKTGVKLRGVEIYQCENMIIETCCAWDTFSLKCPSESAFNLSSNARWKNPLDIRFLHEKQNKKGPFELFKQIPFVSHHLRRVANLHLLGLAR